MFGKDHEYTKLVISHDNLDPEDVYSQVAYEKGFHFLYYLDRLVGRNNFDKFIPHYFAKWSGKSLDSFEFRDTFVEFFNSLGDEELCKKVATIDWDAKFFTPGLPPKPDFDTSMVTSCYELAEKWTDAVSSPWQPPARACIEMISRLNLAPAMLRLSRPTKRLSSSNECNSLPRSALSGHSF